MHFLVSIHTQQIGFFLALGLDLSKEHDVSYLAGDSHVAELVRKAHPCAQVFVNGEEAGGFSGDIGAKALELEQRYGIRLSMLIAQDRALGRGFLFNADRYPKIAKAYWSCERKQAELVAGFLRAEALLETLRPDAIVSLQKEPVLYLVSEYRGIKSLSPAPVKIGERFIWSDNSFLTSRRFLQNISANLQKPRESLQKPLNYEQEAGSKYNHSRIQYTLPNALKRIVHQLALEIYRLLKGTRKKASYTFMGWAPVLLRRPYVFRYFRRRGVSPEALHNNRICYFPLHLEPEIALLSISPEFNNSMEMIAWLSKSAPADMRIVIKEQPLSYGVRSKRYYDQLRQLGNVVLAQPDIPSWRWIEAADVVATITGTAGTEAVHFKKPVLSYGKHQAINLLPTVRFVDNYEATRKAMDELLALKYDDSLFDLSRKAYYTAQYVCSFELPGYSRAYKSKELQYENARIAASNLTMELQDALRLQESRCHKY